MHDQMAALKAIGNDRRAGARGAHRRQQRKFRHLQRGIVMLGFEPEAARHAAAARRDDAVGETGNSFQRFARRLHHAKRSLMALPVRKPPWQIERLQIQAQSLAGMLARPKFLEQE